MAAAVCISPISRLTALICRMGFSNHTDDAIRGEATIIFKYNNLYIQVGMDTENSCFQLAGSPTQVVPTYVMIIIQSVRKETKLL